MKNLKFNKKQIHLRQIRFFLNEKLKELQKELILRIFNIKKKKTTIYYPSDTPFKKNYIPSKFSLKYWDYFHIRWLHLLQFRYLYFNILFLTTAVCLIWNAFIFFFCDRMKMRKDIFLQTQNICNNYEYTYEKFKHQNTTP